MAGGLALLVTANFNSVQYNPSTINSRKNLKKDSFFSIIKSAAEWQRQRIRHGGFFMRERIK